jgi:glucose/arabinose dehydrogenase
MMRRTLLALAAALAPFAAQAQDGEVVRSEAASFRFSTFATGLERPWGAAVLPDGRLLVTERPGRLRLVGTDGSVSAPLGGVPPVLAERQGGLLDVAIAPDFGTTREVFLCHATLVQGGALTRLTRARLAADGSALEAVQPVVDATPRNPPAATTMAAASPSAATGTCSCPPATATRPRNARSGWTTWPARCCA